MGGNEVACLAGLQVYRYCQNALGLDGEVDWVRNDERSGWNTEG